VDLVNLAALATEDRGFRHKGKEDKIDDVQLWKGGQKQ